MAPLFLFFYLIAYKTRTLTSIMLVFVVIPQLTFSLPYIAPGNYNGHYNPIQIPSRLMAVAIFLKHNARGNVLNPGFPLMLPNQYTPQIPYLLPGNEGELLNSLG